MVNRQCSSVTMTVCQTCGDEGYLNLLIFCVQCQIVAVHRYCVDGPSTIDEDEITWHCEDCVPRMAKPAAPCRKSQCISTKIEKEIRGRARRRSRSNLSEKSNLARESAPKVTTTHTSNLNNKCNDGILYSPKGKLQENSTLQFPQVPDDLDSQQGVLQENKSCDAVALTIQKKDLYTNKTVKTKSSKAVVLTRQKDGDLSSDADEGLPVKLEKNVAPQLTKEGDGVQGSTCESYKKSDGNSISEKEHEHGHSFNETQFRPLEEHHRAQEESEVVEGDIAYFLDKRGEDTQSSCAVSECQSPRKKKRRLVIEMEYSEGEKVNVLAEPSPTKPSDVGDIVSTLSGKLPAKPDDLAPPAKPDDHIPTLTSLIKLAKHVLSQPPPPELDNHINCRPIIDAIWRGCCRFNNSIDPIMSFELEAHLSNKAFPIVHGAAIALPKFINFEIVPKCYGWPKKYEKSPPNGDDIGLYLFPVGERDERLYENLLVKMMEHHMMLMSRINNLELLVFCSQELPKHEWRFQNKYYLWGTFRPKQEAMEPSRLPPTQISNSWLSFSAGSPIDEGYQKQNYFHANDHKALNCFTEATLPGNLKHPNPIYSPRTYNNQLGRDKHRSRNYQQCSGKSRYHGKRGHDSIGIKPVQKGSYRTKERYRPNRASDNIWVKPRHENCDDWTFSQ